MKSTIKEHFSAPREPVQANKSKPRLSTRLAGLLGKVSDLVQSDRMQKDATYGELVQHLADCELSESGKMPRAEEIQLICDSAGQSLETLEADVARVVEVRELRTEIAAKADACEALAEAKSKVADHGKEFNNLVASMQAKGDQLLADQRMCEQDVSELKETRQRLHQIAAVTSPEETELTEQICQLGKAEKDVRCQAGREPLIDRYITGRLEDTADFKDLKAIDAKIEELLATDGVGSGTSSADFALRKLWPKQDAISQKISRAKRLYGLGARVVAIRQEKQALSGKRDQLRAETLHKIEAS